VVKALGPASRLLLLWVFFEQVVQTLLALPLNCLLQPLGYGMKAGMWEFVKLKQQLAAVVVW